MAHDPTSLNRRPDAGPHCRSAVLYADEERKGEAESYIKRINDALVLLEPIVAQVAPLDKFYTAEGYHLDCARRNRSNPYIVKVLDPKVEKLKDLYPGSGRRNSGPGDVKGDVAPKVADPKIIGHR